MNTNLRPQEFLRAGTAPPPVLKFLDPPKLVVVTVMTDGDRGNAGSDI